MTPSALASLVFKLGGSANIAITNALAYGAPCMISPPRTEPGLIAAVHLDALPRIAKTWAPPLRAHGLTAKFTGVFCHQSPMVTYRNNNGKTKRCELADLLIVVDAKTPWITGRRAVLIQAKMAAGVGTVSPAGISSVTQLELYQHWPTFDFDTTSYGLSSVDLKHGSDFAQSGTFGVIDRHWRRSLAPKWIQLPATPTPSKTKGFPELGTYIARMLGGISTFGRDADPQSGTPWAKLIEALLRESRSKRFRHRATLGAAAYPRVMALELMHAGSWFFQFYGGSEDTPGLKWDYDPFGISTIHVEITEDG